MEDALYGAADRGELYLDYQPIVAAADGRLIGVEALVRWAHPERGLISPRTLIPLAEHCGLITEVGRWVLGVRGRTASATAARKPDSPCRSTCLLTS